MSTVDRSKLILYSPDNAFKNVNSYPGSLTYPTSLLASQAVEVTTTIQLSEVPVFTQFFANFLEVTEAIGLYISAAGTTPKRWYSGNVGGNYGVGIHINTAGKLGWIGCGISPALNGSTLTVTGTVINPYAVPVTLDPITVNFVLTEFALAG